MNLGVPCQSSGGERSDGRLTSSTSHKGPSPTTVGSTPERGDGKGGWRVTREKTSKDIFCNSSFKLPRR